MKSVILDVDGTIWDTTTEVAKCWTKVINENGIEIELSGEQLGKLFGLPMDMLIKAILPNVPEQERMEVAEKAVTYENEHLRTAPIKPYDGVVETIKNLSEITDVYIVSNANSGYIESMMENLQIEKYIKDFTCYGDTGEYKDKNIQYIIEKNKISDPIYVGDTEMDRQACKSANVPFVYAAYGLGNVKEKPDYQIQSFKEIISLIV